MGWRVIGIKVDIHRNLLIEDTHPYSSGWWIRDDVYNWLKTSVGPGSQAGGWQEDCAWQWDYRFEGRPINNRIVFHDKDHAMLFKLTWGGQ